MCYQPEFLNAAWSDYLTEKGGSEGKVVPDAFIRRTYTRALAHRAPRYSAMAENWGIKVAASDVAQIRAEADMADIVAAALPK